VAVVDDRASTGAYIYTSQRKYPKARSIRPNVMAGLKNPRRREREVSYIANRQSECVKGGRAMLERKMRYVQMVIVSMQ
jgi:hypothetical protein